MSEKTPLLAIIKTMENALMNAIDTAAQHGTPAEAEFACQYLEAWSKLPRIPDAVDIEAEDRRIDAANRADWRRKQDMEG